MPSEVTIIHTCLAKSLHQVHGAAPDGSILFRKTLSLPQFTVFAASRD